MIQRLSLCVLCWWPVQPWHTVLRKPHTLGAYNVVCQRSGFDLHFLSLQIQQRFVAYAQECCFRSCS